MSRGALICLVLLGTLPAHGVATPGAAAEPTVEHRVKAAMLFNFTRFIAWPGAGGPELSLCVVGEDPLTAALDGIHGKETGDRTVTVRPAVSPAHLARCHMAFISRSEAASLPPLLDALKARPVVTVSDIPGFVERGGMVELVVVEGKVRFEVNIGAAEQAGLRFSSKLLRLARQVVGRGGS